MQRGTVKKKTMNQQENDSMRENDKASMETVTITQRPKSQQPVQ